MFNNATSHNSFLFIALNLLRGLSIIALLLVLASNVEILADDIKAVHRFDALEESLASNGTTSMMYDCDYIEGSTVPNQTAGVFWAVVNRLFTILSCIVLMLAEIGFPMRYINPYIPILGSEFGVGAIGVFQCLIAASVLSHHIPAFALVSAFFLFAVGGLNIIIGLFLRERSKSLRSLSDSPNLPFFSNNQADHSKRHKHHHRHAPKSSTGAHSVTTQTQTQTHTYTDADAESTLSSNTVSSLGSTSGPYGNQASQAFGRQMSLREKRGMHGVATTPPLLSRELSSNSLQRMEEAHVIPRVVYSTQVQQQPRAMKKEGSDEK